MCQLGTAGTDDERFRLMKALADTTTILGLPEFLDALEKGNGLTRMLISTASLCISLGRISNHTSSPQRGLSFEDLVSLLPSKFSPQPPSLKVLQEHLENGKFGFMRKEDEFTFLPQYLLDQWENPTYSSKFSFVFAYLRLHRILRGRTLPGQ